MVTPGPSTSQKNPKAEGGPWLAQKAKVLGRLPTAIAQMNREDQAHNLPVRLLANAWFRGDVAEKV